MWKHQELSLMVLTPVLVLYMTYKSHYPSSQCRKCKRMCLLHSRRQEGLAWWLSDKESACNAGNEGDWVRSLGREDPLEKEMAIHSSILAWKIPWTEEPGRLQSLGSQRVWHDLASKPPSTTTTATTKHNGRGKFETCMKLSQFMFLDPELTVIKPQIIK